MVRKIADVMTRSVITVARGSPVMEVVRLMADNSISCVVITDASGKPAGIVTERDMVRRVLRNAIDPREVPIDDVMSSPVMTISPEKRITQAIGLMNKYHFRRVVVAGKDGRLLGILTQSDLLMEVHKVQMELERMNENLRNTIASLRRYRKVGTEAARVRELKQKVTKLERAAGK